MLSDHPFSCYMKIVYFTFLMVLYSFLLLLPCSFVFCGPHPRSVLLSLAWLFLPGCIPIVLSGLPVSPTTSPPPPTLAWDAQYVVLAFMCLIFRFSSCEKFHSALHNLKVVLVLNVFPHSMTFLCPSEMRYYNHRFPGFMIV